MEPELDAFSYQTKEVVLCHQQSLLKDSFTEKEYTDFAFLALKSIYPVTIKRYTDLFSVKSAQLEFMGDV